MPRREPTGEAAELIAAAQVATQRIGMLGRADADLLEPIIAAVLAETARNRFPTAAILAGLTAEYAEARTAVAALAADPRGHVRRRALRCLGCNTPRAFATEILRTTVADADAGVRLKAASVASMLGLVIEIGTTNNARGTIDSGER